MSALKSVVYLVKVSVLDLEKIRLWRVDTFLSLAIVTEKERGIFLKQSAP